MTRRIAKINPDLTPRKRAILAKGPTVTYDKNHLDVKRKTFSPAQRDLASKIGTPAQGDNPPRRK